VAADIGDIPVRGGGTAYRFNSSTSPSSSSTALAATPRTTSRASSTGSTSSGNGGGGGGGGKGGSIIGNQTFTVSSHHDIEILYDWLNTFHCETPNGLVTLGVVPPGQSLGLCFLLTREVWSITIYEDLIKPSLETGYGLSEMLQNHFVGMFDIYASAAMMRGSGLHPYLNAVIDAQIAAEMMRAPQDVTYLLNQQDRGGGPPPPSSSKTISPFIRLDLLRKKLSSSTWRMEIGQEKMTIIRKASLKRLAYALSNDYAINEGRPICYIKENESFGSSELWSLMDENINKPCAVDISTELEPLLALVPWELFSDYEEFLRQNNTTR